MKPAILALLIASAAYGQITCSTATSTSPCPVTAGVTTTLTATSSVTWSLAGNGSLSTTGPSLSTVYTAPYLAAHNVRLGCPIGPNDTIFNTPITNAPADSQSATKIANSLNTSPILNILPSWGVSYADASTPTFTQIPSFGYPSVSNYARPNAGPQLLEESGDYTGLLNQYAAASSVPDHHVMTVRHTDCSTFEDYDTLMYGATFATSCGPGGSGATNCTSRGAQTYAVNSYGIQTGNIDAAGLELAPIILHLDEILSGTIHHPLRFTVLTYHAANSFAWPATATAGGSVGTFLQFGQYLRLNSGFSIAGVCTTGGTVEKAACTTILTALKNYGMVLADNGEAFQVEADTDVMLDPAVAAAINDINFANIAPSNFTALDLTSFQQASNSLRVCPYNTSCLSGTQSYQTLPDQVTVTGGSTAVAVAVQPITVGSSLPPEWPVAAGTYTINLDSFAWTNPSTLSQARTWSVVSNSCSSGTLYVSGLLTVPTAGACVMVVQAASNVDGTNPLLLTLPVIPAPSGNVRIDSGASTNTTISGTTWYADTGAQGSWPGLFTYQNDSFSWPSANPNLTIYESGIVAYGNDFRYTVGVPNGKYNVHLLFGIEAQFTGCNANPCGTWPNPSGKQQYAFNPSLIETQGNAVGHVDWNNSSNFLNVSPVDVYVPALVTNNILQIAVDDFAPETLGGSTYNGLNFATASPNKINQLSGVEILSVTTSPSLTIDPGFNAPNNLVAAASSSQPFYAVFNYVAPSSVTWTASGQVCNQVGCTLTATPWGDGGEILSLGSGTLNALQPITITASGGGYTATLTLYTSGSSVIVSP